MTLQRSLADLACRALLAALPPALQSWGQAIRCETMDIPKDTEALHFALGSLLGLMPRVIAFHLGRPVASLVGAVMLGVIYLAMAGAPTRDLAVNLGALLAGLAIMMLIGRGTTMGRHETDGMVVAMAALLLATALLGEEVNGVSRWIRLGGLALQPSLVLLPAMILAFARSPNALRMTGMVMAAAALAIMPDRAMAGALMTGLATLSVMRRDRNVSIALATSLAAFIITMVRADTLPVSPYVDGVLLGSWDVHLLAGAAVLGGALLLLAPALIGWRGDAGHRAHHVVFGAIWLACLAAAATGRSPTPVVGYGGSAILGYALSLAVLSRSVTGHQAGQNRPGKEEVGPPHLPLHRASGASV